MFTYFHCEKYHCTMQRRHCITRMAKTRKGACKLVIAFAGCRGCEQGRQNAIDCGVLVQPVGKWVRDRETPVGASAVLP